MEQGLIICVFLLQLDEWVLCRIYKKSTGAAAQKPMTTSVSSKEHSNGSSSSCSSQLDDVLEWLPEIDDSRFSLPRINSLKTLHQLDDQKLGSGNFDWASLAGLNSVPELVPNNQAQQLQGNMNMNMNMNYNNNDMYVVPSIPPLCHVESPPERPGKTVEEEVQSGLRTQRVDNSGFFQQNSNVLTQNYCNPIDPYGLGNRFGRGQ